MKQLSLNKKNAGEYWISVSDMMTGLMVIFLFIAVSYMIRIISEKNSMKEIAITYSRLQDDLYSDLYKEFKNDLPKWDAEIDKSTLSIKFKSPDVLFAAGSARLQRKFINILNDFFPRYINILKSNKYKNDINEIRIEGHTSSEWSFEVAEDIAYMENMRLSQDRTRSVLGYVLFLPTVKNDREWLESHLTANGLSSSKLIIKNGIEDKEKSRRVEFRVKTNAEKRIVKILENSN